MSKSHKIDNFILKQFLKLYPDPHSELDFNGPFQLCIAVLLSAQCTDKKVNQVTPELFGRFPDFEALANARLSVLEQIIRPINYYKTKSKNVQQLARQVVERFDATLPMNFDALTSLPGIGRKSASVILCEIGKEQTLPVDTHVFRVSKRLSLAAGNTPEKVETELRARFKPEHWRNLHHWLIFHGRRVCKAQRPLCQDCPLLPQCPEGLKRNA